jgi:hypothetical protein
MTAPHSIFDVVPPLSHDPAWLVAPLTPLEQRFKAFHEQNPAIYRRLEMRAVHESNQGASRLSIAKLAEQLRADVTVQTVGDEFKINNSFRALYARLLIHRNPELNGKFEVRERRESRPDTVGATDA